VKCNPDAHLLRFLADLGLGFDCASPFEIQLVLGLGVDPSRIIFSHPCKSISALHMASSRGVMLATFDNADELDKIKSVCPAMRLLLRIYAQDDTARVCLGKKFGAPPHTTHPLLSKARALALKVVGVSFHIGMSTLLLPLSSQFL
jgi:ornithine decarboxylase